MLGVVKTGRESSELRGGTEAGSWCHEIAARVPESRVVRVSWSNGGSGGWAWTLGGGPEAPSWKIESQNFVEERRWGNLAQGEDQPVVESRQSFVEERRSSVTHGSSRSRVVRASWRNGGTPLPWSRAVRNFVEERRIGAPANHAAKLRGFISRRTASGQKPRGGPEGLRRSLKRQAKKAP